MSRLDDLKRELLSIKGDPESEAIVKEFVDNWDENNTLAEIELKVRQARERKQRGQ